MLDEARLAEITREVGRKDLTPKWFDDVIVEPAIDSDGNEALRITVVLARMPSRNLSGDAVSRFLLELGERLDAEGETRTRLLHWATREELAVVDDPES